MPNSRQSNIPAGLINWRRAFTPLMFLTLAACGSAQEDTPPPDAPYDKEEANIELWLERLEVNSRELYAAREAVIEALSLKSGDRIADIGAGTGVYTLLMAEKVGMTGAVFAVDIEPRFLTLINRRSADLDLSNVTAVLSRETSVTLPAGAVDVAFICDTYNYFDEPEAMMKTVHDALSPGGRLYIVDLDLTPDRPASAHIRVGKQALAQEIEGYGFTQKGVIKVEGLSQAYMLAFEKEQNPAL